MKLKSIFLGGRLLSSYTEGRDNNYLLIRLVASSAVLVSHSFPISQGAEAPQPLESTFGFTMGLFAVYTFFFVSGFLVSQSYCRGRNLFRFFLARFLRIFPGLMVVILLAAFVLGPIASKLGPQDYFAQFEVYTYVLRNISLAFLQYPLPGVFESNIYGPAINGSLWTLPYEIACYIALGLAAVTIGVLNSRRNFWLAVAAYGVLWILFLLVPHDDAGGWHRLGVLLDLSGCFVLGVGAFLHRGSIPLNLATVASLVLAAILLLDTALFRPAFFMALGYSVLYIAYVPRGRIRTVNRLPGDYSYGIYIYAFPVQQSLAYLYPGIDTMSLMAVAFVITVMCAAISWHVIEKPALDLRKLPAFQSWKPSRKIT